TNSSDLVELPAISEEFVVHEASVISEEVTISVNQPIAQSIIEEQVFAETAANIVFERSAPSVPVEVESAVWIEKILTGETSLDEQVSKKIESQDLPAVVETFSSEVVEAAIVSDESIISVNQPIAQAALAKKFSIETTIDQVGFSALVETAGIEESIISSETVVVSEESASKELVLEIEYIPAVAETVPPEVVDAAAIFDEVIISVDQPIEEQSSVEVVTETIILETASDEVNVSMPIDVFEKISNSSDLTSKEIVQETASVPAIFEAVSFAETPLISDEVVVSTHQPITQSIVQVEISFENVPKTTDNQFLGENSVHQGKMISNANVIVSKEPVSEENVIGSEPVFAVVEAVTAEIVATPKVFEEIALSVDRPIEQQSIQIVTAVSTVVFVPKTLIDEVAAEIETSVVEQKSVSSKSVAIFEKPVSKEISLEDESSPVAVDVVSGVVEPPVASEELVISVEQSSEQSLLQEQLSVDAIVLAQDDTKAIIGIVDQIQIENNTPGGDVKELEFPTNVPTQQVVAVLPAAELSSFQESYEILTESASEITPVKTTQRVVKVARRVSGEETKDFEDYEELIDTSNEILAEFGDKTEVVETVVNPVIENVLETVIEPNADMVTAVPTFETDVVVALVVDSIPDEVPVVAEIISLLNETVVQNTAKDIPEKTELIVSEENDVNVKKPEVTVGHTESIVESDILPKVTTSNTTEILEFERTVEPAVEVPVADVELSTVRKFGSTVFSAQEVENKPSSDSKNEGQGSVQLERRGFFGSLFGLSTAKQGTSPVTVTGVMPVKEKAANELTTWNNLEVLPLPEMATFEKILIAENTVTTEPPVEVIEVVPISGADIEDPTLVIEETDLEKTFQSENITPSRIKLEDLIVSHNVVEETVLPVSSVVSETHAVSNTAASIVDVENNNEPENTSHARLGFFSSFFGISKSEHVSKVSTETPEFIVVKTQHIGNEDAAKNIPAAANITLNVNNSETKLKDHQAAFTHPSSVTESQILQESVKTNIAEITQIETVLEEPVVVLDVEPRIVDDILAAS
ncbi:hypothetical protein HK100_007825, partial [Physocladia obscura]